jgi:hypothetical protein
VTALGTVQAPPAPPARPGFLSVAWATFLGYALGEVPRRMRRPVAIAMAVGAPLMAVYVLGYAATHPLRFDANFTAGGKRVFEREPGKLVQYTSRLENTGAAAVTDMAVVRAEGSPALQVERAGLRANLWESPAQVRLEPLAGVELEKDDHDRWLTLELRQGSSCPTPVARLDAIWIRYTVLGMRHEQRVPLVNGPSVRCR